MNRTVLMSVFLFFIITTVDANNLELEQLKTADQASRSGAGQDHKDQERRIRVLELLAFGEVKTPQDKVNAALVLQHTGFTFCGDQMKSISPENYLLAHNLVKSAIESGHKGSEFLFAQTIDRYLSMTQGTQRYGTNVLFDQESGEAYYPKIDRTITDEERAKYGVPSLKELLSNHPEREPVSN